MKKIRLRLFGPPAVEAKGSSIAFDTRKALALLSYLAVSGGSHSRDQLAAFLWPEGDLAHGRGALRRTLSSLRKHLGEDQLHADRNAIEVTGGVTTDVAEFEDLLKRVNDHHQASPLCDECVASLRTATSMCQGPFMSGFELRDSTAFDDWRYMQEESLRKDLAFGLQQLATSLADAGAYREALPVALRWVDLDPLHEPAHVVVMRLHALNDDRNASLEQYRRLVRTLDEELGVSPLEETSALQRAIASGSVAEPRRRGDRTAGPTHIETPFVGRARELSSLAAAASASVTTGRLVVIEGEAGIGKTRLAREASRRAVVDGRGVLEVPNHEEESDHPYGLIARLLSTVLEDLPASRMRGLDDLTFAEVVRLAPDIGSLRPDLPPAPPLADPGAKTNFFHALWEFLSTTLDGWVVLLDDLQWSDSASIDVLSYISRRLQELPVLLILSWRTEEVPRDHQLRKLLGDARRDDRLDQLVLGRLERGDVERIVRERLPDAASSTAERIYGESEGLPFFVSEYVDLLASGRAAVDDITLPEGALDIVRARLEPIEGSARQILTAASVLGRSFDLSLVQATAGRSDEETVDALEELVDRSLIAEVPSTTEPTYDFTHEKIRSLVYNETSLARRRLLHGRAADFLTAPRPHVRPDDVVLAAYHSESAGRTAKAAELQVAAGVRARDLFANAEALSHFERALALGHPDTARLHEKIGDMQVLLGHYGAALRSYETAGAYTNQTGIPNLERKLAEVRIRSGEKQLGREHLSLALELVDPNDPLRADLLADMTLALSDDDPEAALRSAEEAARVGEKLEAPSAVARARNLLGLLARRAGRMDEAIENLSQSLAAAEATDDVAAIVAALNNLALVRRQGGEIEEATELTRRALDLCRRRGDVHREAALHNNLADLLHEAGDEEGSRSHSKEAARLFSGVGEEPVPPPEIWKLTDW